MKYLKIALIFLLTVAIFDMPYYYYEIMRFLCMVGFLILAKLEYDKKHNVLLTIWLSIALLINPYFKLKFGKEVWQSVDFILIILLVFTIFDKSKD